MHTDEPLGHFESSLLEELKPLVRRGAEPVRRRHRRALIVATGLAALVTAGAVGAELSHVFSASPRKLELPPRPRLQSGRHIGPAVASSGRFTLYASGADVELFYSEASTGWSAVTRFPASRRSIARSISRSIPSEPDAIFGRTRLRRAAGAVVRYPDGRAQQIRLGLRGFFVVAVPAGSHARGATVTVLDAAGRELTRLSVAS